MFAKSRKEKFVEQAQSLANDLTDAIAPHVERARDELAPRLADAREQIGPRLTEARDQIAPHLQDARDQLAPHVESARDRFRSEVLPVVQQGVSDARAQATLLAEEARERSANAAAAIKGEPVKKKGKKRKLLLLAVVVGVAGAAAKKLSGGGESDNWQTSYTPTPPAPPAPPTPPSPAAPMSGSHAAAVPTDGTTEEDLGGAAPGERMSDSTEEPHPVTTPDSPAEDIDVSDVDDPRP